MLKLSLKILSQLKSQPNQGFTILEAIAAILISLGFVLTSLQAIVIATAFRVKVQEKQLATQLIQEEIDNLKSQGNALNCVEVSPATTPPTCDDPIDYNPVLSRCTATQYSDGYAQALWTAYTGSTSYAAEPAKTISGNRRVGLRRLSEDLFAASTPDDYDNGASLPTSIIPHSSLKIWYEVREWDGETTDGSNLDLSGDAIATDYIEITPNAALQCP